MANLYNYIKKIYGNRHNRCYSPLFKLIKLFDCDQQTSQKIHKFETAINLLASIADSQKIPFLQT
jgi:hypothetical protein